MPASHERAQAQIMAVPDSTSVSETGSAIQSFPISVPPGTAGVVPSLSLTYNSQGQNGIVGMGFMLNGLASIGRCPKTQATDGMRGSINFNADDRFVSTAKGSLQSAALMAPMARNTAPRSRAFPRLFPMAWLALVPPGSRYGPNPVR